MPRARATRIREPAPLEREIHEQCVEALEKYLDSPPAEWCAYPAGLATLHPAQQARYTRGGLKRGYPDLFVFYMGCFGLEIKRPGQKPSKSRIEYTKAGYPRIIVGQEEMFPRLINSGGFTDIQIIHSVDEMMKQLYKWGIPTRPGWEKLL